MILKAPMDGIVVMQSMRRGMEYGQAQKGDQISSGQMFMQIVDPDSMVVNASVNQVDANCCVLGRRLWSGSMRIPGLSCRLMFIRSAQFRCLAAGRISCGKSLSGSSWTRMIPGFARSLGQCGRDFWKASSRRRWSRWARFFTTVPAGKPYVFLRGSQAG